MSPLTRRLIFWAVPAAAVVIGLAFAFRPQPLPVDLVAVEQGDMVVTVAEEGVARIKDVFVVSAPVRGRALRIEIREGDDVIAEETIVAEIEPIDPDFLDIRSEAEARAAVDIAQAALTHARAQLSQAQAELRFATAERDRITLLRRSGTVSVRALEDANRIYETRNAAVKTQFAAVAMRASELDAAQIRLQRPTQSATTARCPCIPIRAPVSGKALRILHESEGVVAAGQPLLEIGNPRELEIVADFLSSDAVRIENGQRVIIDAWGGQDTLSGIVVRVEPYGFTKVSALGIEEQRVNVVIDLTDPPARWTRLGHGFRTDVRVVLWEDQDVTKIPLTSLFRNDGDWHVFVEEDGRAVSRSVEIGHRTDLEAQITSGLTAGDKVVRYPTDFLFDGARIEQR